jgi:hypothetical protein
MHHHVIICDQSHTNNQELKEALDALGFGSGNGSGSSGSKQDECVLQLGMGQQGGDYERVLGLCAKPWLVKESVRVGWDSISMFLIVRWGWTGIKDGAMLPDGQHVCSWIDPTLATQPPTAPAIRERAMDSSSNNNNQQHDKGKEE